VSTTIIDVPMGTVADLKVTESAGVLSFPLTVQFAPIAGLSIAGTMQANLSTIVLVNAWAAASTNAAVKAGLTELAALLGVLPA
jgi:hypothetical protein